MDAGSEKLIQDVRTLVRDAEDLIKATAGEIGDRTRDARVRLAGTLAVARETCNRLEERAAHADRFVRNRPYQSTAAGFTLGIVVGVLAARCFSSFWTFAKR